MSTDQDAPPAPPSADDLRRRKRRRRRQAGTFLGLVTLVVVVGVLAFGHWVQWWTFGEGDRAEAQIPCPAQTALQPGQVTVNVYNATERRGLARAVAKEMTARGFRIAAITNDTSGRPVAGIAAVRHGPAGRLSARSVAVQMGPQGKGVAIEADARTSRRVDLVVGNGFKGMRPREESKAALAPVPKPAGCVPVTAPPATPAAVPSAAVQPSGSPKP